MWIVNKSLHHKSRGFSVVSENLMGKKLCTRSHANYVNDMNMCDVNLNMCKIFKKKHLHAITREIKTHII